MRLAAFHNHTRTHRGRPSLHDGAHAMSEPLGNRACRPSGDRLSEPMNEGTLPEELSADVLDDVANVVGAPVAVLRRLSGGINAGAVRVRLAGGADAVLKAEPRAHDHLDEALRARRVVEHMRGRGYPTPAWLAVGATATHVWHLMDFVDAAPCVRVHSVPR